MKRYRVEKLAVVKLTYYTNAKNENNAAKAMQNHEEELENMDIDYVLSLPEIGTYVQEIKPPKRKSS